MAALARIFRPPQSANAVKPQPTLDHREEHQQHDQRMEIGSPYKIEGLSPRESEIAVYAALGYKNREIGEKAGINEQTVRNHLRLVYLKLRIQKREQLEPIVWDQVPQVRNEMLKLGRAPQSPASPAVSISRPPGNGRGAEDVVTPEVRS